jgi:deoxycytidylate deaminase
VVCHLYDATGVLVATGSNKCANPQETCPREPGEGYDKCLDICGQYGHAEEVALKNARGHDLAGGKAVITHKRVCKACMRSLVEAAIAEVECVG